MLLTRTKTNATLRLDKLSNDQAEALAAINAWKANIISTAHSDYRYALWRVELEGSEEQCDRFRSQLARWEIGGDR